jgi:divalent metal cation (Fe/Co/Zn/Cd) transporter
MILHYVFIGVYIAAIVGIVFAVIYVSHQKADSHHRHGH